jgi:AcrR family transcriptional regulator
MSPVATIDDTTARAAVLGTADAAFYERGVGGVGMAEIRDRSGVSLRRLYSLYPTKSDLVAAWLDNRHHAWMAWFTSAVERLSADGRDPLLAGFDAIAEWRETPGYRGCAFVNTAAEWAEIDERHRTIISDHKRGLTEYLVELARTAGHTDPDDLGATFAVLLDGAMVTSAVLGSAEPIVLARRAAARLLEQAR